MPENKYYEVKLADYDDNVDNNVPEVKTSLVIISSVELTKTDIAIFCRENIDISFDEVFSVSEISRQDVDASYEKDDIYEYDD